MIKKLSKIFLFSSLFIGALLGLIFKSDAVIAFSLPPFLSLISVSIYLFVYKENSNQKYVFIHLLIDLIILILMFILFKDYISHSLKF